MDNNGKITDNGHIYNKTITNTDNCNDPSDRLNKYFSVSDVMASTQMTMDDFIAYGRSLKGMAKEINGKLELTIDETGKNGNITIESRKWDMRGTLCVKLGSMLMDLENIKIEYDEIKKAVLLKMIVPIVDMI